MITFKDFTNDDENVKKLHKVFWTYLVHKLKSYNGDDLFNDMPSIEGKGLSLMYKMGIIDEETYFKVIYNDAPYFLCVRSGNSCCFCVNNGISSNGGRCFNGKLDELYWTFPHDTFKEKRILIAEEIRDIFEI